MVFQWKVIKVIRKLPPTSLFASVFSKYGGQKECLDSNLSAGSRDESDCTVFNLKSPRDIKCLVLTDHTSTHNKSRLSVSKNNERNSSKKNLSVEPKKIKNWRNKLLFTQTDSCDESRNKATTQSISNGNGAKSHRSRSSNAIEIPLKLLNNKKQISLYQICENVEKTVETDCNVEILHQNNEYNVEEKNDSKKCLSFISEIKKKSENKLSSSQTENCDERSKCTYEATTTSFSNVNGTKSYRNCYSKVTENPPEPLDNFKKGPIISLFPIWDTPDKTVETDRNNRLSDRHDKQPTFLPVQDIANCGNFANDTTNDHSIRQSYGLGTLTGKSVNIEKNSNTEFFNELLAAEIAAHSTGKLLPVIKQELKYKIQTRRLQNGLDELQVDTNFSPNSEKRFPMTIEEICTYQKRKAQNKNSAAKKRHMLRVKEEELLKMIDQEVRKKQKLEEEVKGLEEEKEQLQSILYSYTQTTSTRELNPNL